MPTAACAGGCRAAQGLQLQSSLGGFKQQRRRGGEAGQWAYSAWRPRRHPHSPAPPADMAQQPPPTAAAAAAAAASAVCSLHSPPAAWVATAHSGWRCGRASVPARSLRMDPFRRRSSIKDCAHLVSQVPAAHGLIDRPGNLDKQGIAAGQRLQQEYSTPCCDEPEDENSPVLPSGGGHNGIRWEGGPPALAAAGVNSRLANALKGRSPGLVAAPCSSTR